MNLTYPNTLLALWLLPVLAVLLWRSARTARRRSLLFLSEPMGERLMPNQSTERIFLRESLLIAGIGLSVFALAGPQFGVYFEKVSRRGADLVVLLDTSRSMLAEDVSPNRLEAAKLDIEDLLAEIAGDRIGLIAFAGKPIVKAPLTGDLGFFRETLKKIDVKTAPRGGTAIGDAIRLALRSMAPDANRSQAIILISDGEDQDSMPLEAARDAAERGVRIFTVALGNMNEGARIPLFDQNGKRTGYEKYQNQEVWSKTDGKQLAQIAQETGGAYLPAGTAACNLGAFYRDSLGSLERSDYQQSEKRRLHEKYQLFLAAALLCLAAAAVIRPNRPSNDETPGLKNSRIAIALALAATLTFGTGLAAQTPNAPTADSPTESAKPLNETTATIPPETPDESAREKTSDAEPQTPKSKKRSAQTLYNEACRAMNDPTRSDEAADLLRQALEQARKKERRLVADIHFNLGLLAAQRLDEAAQNTLADSTETDHQNPIAAEKTAEPNAPQPQSPLDSYRQGAAERQSKQRAVFEQADSANNDFLAARDGASNRTQIDAEKNIDLIRSWKQSQTDHWQRDERQRRLQTLPPADHLQWTEEELDDTLTTLERDGHSIAGQRFQQLYETAERAEELVGDLDALRSQTPPDAADSSYSPNAPDQTSLDLAAETLTKASKNARQYNDLSARGDLRKTVENVNAARTAALDYPTLLTEAVERQKKIVEKTKALAADADTPKPNQNQLAERFDDIGWRDDFTARYTERLMNDAEKEFAERPFLPEEAETASDENDAPPENAAEQSPEKAQEETLKKIRRSMKLAQELGPEIIATLTAAHSKTSEQKSDGLSADEEKALTLLQEIQKPLQDQNQNQQNQNQQNQNQDQNQDQNQQNKQNGQNQQQNESSEQNQEQPQENQPSEEQKSPESKNQNDPKEQEAEATMRKVRQRQQAAEEMRKLRDEYLRRTEKPEKDW